MPRTPGKRPNQSRSQWLITLLLFTSLIFFGLRYATDHNREKEQLFKNAEEVPLSQITSGYNAQEYKQITIEGNKVFAEPTGSGTVVQSYRGGESIAELGWNDSSNPTIVSIENQEGSILFDRYAKVSHLQHEIRLPLPHFFDEYGQAMVRIVHDIFVDIGN